MQLNFKLFSTKDVSIYCEERKTKLLIHIDKKKISTNFGSNF